MLSAARALGAVNLLSGSLYKLGDNIRIDARLEEVATGKIILGEKVVGRDAFALVDSLTAKIAQGLNVSELMSSHVSVSELTSSSPEAYRLYHEGMENFELELYDEAIEKFNRALAIDPGFALAYMRIGMAKVFQGRPQEGAGYFALAQEYKSRLPLREKSLLDIYSGFWLEQRYDESFVRLETFVNHYPDDKEGRTFYAVVFFAFAQDTASAFAHLDTVLHSDPQYQLALSFYSQVYQQYGNLEKAVEYAKLIRTYHPESPYPYIRLATLYARQSKLDEAIDECQNLLSRFPDNPEALLRLSNLYIHKRDFEKSRQYLDQVAERYRDDPYRMDDYYHARANLANWSGKFRSSLDLRFQALKHAKLTGDSTIIFNALEAISVYYERYGLPDSALFYSRQAYLWAIPFQRLDHPIRLVSIDYKTEPEARPIFKESLDEFKSRMPSQLWALIDLVEQLFEAYCQLDTAAMIEAREELARQQQQEGGSSVLAGYLRVLSGRYESGIEILQRFLSGRHETTSGFRYPYILYMLGIANEGLGNTEEAIQNYEEMLQYWGSPEIELKEIKDARTRLAKLTS
jgi:tetratricopeptide (TPR) repeat protein